MILGKPLVYYLGILTIGVVFASAILGYAVRKTQYKVQFKYHYWVAIAALVVAVIHGGLVFLGNL